MRIVAVSSYAGPWQTALDEWRRLPGETAAEVDPNEDGRSDGELAARVRAGLVESVGAAAVNTRSITPDEGCEGALDRLICEALFMRCLKVGSGRVASSITLSPLPGRPPCAAIV